MKSSPKMLTQVKQDEKEAAQKPLSFGLIRRLLGYMVPYAGRRNMLIGIVVVRAIQLPLLAWAIGAVIGGPVSRLDGMGVMLGAIGYLALAAFTQVTLCFRLRFAQELGENVIRDIRGFMFSHLQKLPMAYFQRVGTGRLISRFTSDAEAVRSGVQDLLFVSIVGGGQIIVAAAFMAYYDVVLFLVVAGMTPVLWGMNRLVHGRLSRAYRTMQESFSRVTATLAESVSGIRVTQGFVREDVNAGLFHDLVRDHARYNIDAARISGVFLPMLEFNSQLFISLVLMIGGWRVFNGFADVQALYQFVLMSAIFFGPIQWLGTQYNMALTAMAGAERVFRLLDTKPEWSDPPDAHHADQIVGRVVFDKVDFGYLPGTLVLREISFVAEPGQTVALVGHTGSGKSSIINLIAKFYLPTHGRLSIDGIDILNLETHSLRSRIGIVLQQNFLFTGTVMDNIRTGRPGATDAEVIAAAERLGCRDSIETLPAGFATVVGERGAGISVGQRQLICFARAMLADPRILILDEATSAVDTLTEARLQQAMDRLLSGRTSFVVAHRLSTILHAEQVLVLEDGRIIERGTHAELVEHGRVYANLYEQFIQSTSA